MYKYDDILNVIDQMKTKMLPLRIEWKINQNDNDSLFQ